jgi:YVTN family beta-propeller protein
MLTPDAAPGSRLFDLDPHLAVAPWFRAGGAVATALSPDGRTLLVLTSGYNRVYREAGQRVDAASSEYVFVYDVTGGAPRETQVILVPNTFGGLAFSADGSRFFVTGGPDDDVHEVVRDARTESWGERMPPIDLEHADPRGLGGLGVNEGPFAAGVAVSASGTRLAVAEHENDALSIVDLGSRRRVADVPLAPPSTEARAGGEFPRGVAVVGETRAFVASQRDREVVEVDLGAAQVVRRIVVGAQPTALLANRAGTHLYVADAGSDAVSVVDVAAGREVDLIPTTAPPGMLAPALRPLRGSNPNGLALSPDERTLYVTNGGNSTLAVIALDEAGLSGRVVGLVPTGFYPNAVSVSHDGRWLYVAHGKSLAGPNPQGPWSDAALAGEYPYAPGGGNQYALQLMQGGLLAAPRPEAAVLDGLTRQAVANDFAQDVERVPPVFQRLRGVVKHVVFVVAENRTYDQLLGDLQTADGDPRLVHWGERITPNHHALARRFVTLDRFFATGGVSGDGWQWTMGARTTDVAEKAVPVKYADRGHHTYDFEGLSRGINVGLATDDERLAFNPYTPRGQLPGAVDVTGPDALLWDAALAAGRTTRVYGVFCDDTRYGFADVDTLRIPPLRMPHDTGTRVAFPTRASLMAVEDPFYRGFDMRFPDAWRVAEWRRELDGYVAANDLPGLSIVRLPHDHLGSFGDSVDGVDTPDTQMADHDWAVGSLIEALSRSPFWESTVVIVVEDDAQNGSDHVDAHRTIALLAGGHVRRGAVVHTPYTTTSVLRTIELLLGLAPLTQHDAVAPPMEDLFDERADDAPFTAIVPAVLRSTRLPLPPPRPGELAEAPRHDAAWWAAATAGFDFDHVDSAPAGALNRVLYCGLVDDSGCATKVVTASSDE